MEECGAAGAPHAAVVPFRAQPFAGPAHVQAVFGTAGGVIFLQLVTIRAHRRDVEIFSFQHLLHHIDETRKTSREVGLFVSHRPRIVDHEQKIDLLAAFLEDRWRGRYVEHTRCWAYRRDHTIAARWRFTRFSTFGASRHFRRGGNFAAGG